MINRIIASNNPILFVDPWGLTKDGRPERILPGYPGLWDVPYNWVKDNPGKAIDLAKITIKHIANYLIGKTTDIYLGSIVPDLEASPLPYGLPDSGGDNRNCSK